MSGKSNIAEQWHALKLQFAALTAELGALEYQKQRKGMELINLEMQMSEFWKKNKDEINASQARRSQESS